MPRDRLLPQLHLHATQFLLFLLLSFLILFPSVIFLLPLPIRRGRVLAQCIQAEGCERQDTFYKVRAWCPLQKKRGDDMKPSFPTHSAAGSCTTCHHTPTRTPTRTPSDHFQYLSSGHRCVALLTQCDTINVGIKGARGSVVVKALFYKLEGRGFDSR
jgi:hypothetical protein